MKAAQISAPGQELKIIERERPKPGPGQVLVHVHACGICHSDVDLIQGHFPFASFPTIPGHEVAGVVEELGEYVSWPALGTRVGIPWLYSSCGHCIQCVRGKEVLCPEGKITGVNVEGGYQEYMLAPAAFVAPLPDKIDFMHAAPLMDAGLTVFNGLRQGNFKPGQKVAVLGLGGLGHLAVRIAIAMGGRVAIVSRARGEAEKLAQSLGAEKFIASSETDIALALQQWDGGADVILNTAPTTAQANAALPGLAPDGTLVIMGFDATPLTANPGVMIHNRMHIVGSPSGSRQDLRDTLEFCAIHGIVPDITPITLEQAPDILAKLEAGTMKGRAVIIFS
ncbi:alcohol dehydrogenase catalytic domain-containing protein [Dictyobacter formicarum]|uniref:alcohol dehydrogenase n=1 Tax=Dictyobacter formicarum TaxID=2778368 RepID=A0ABQ3VU46_9CHLR|nr:alcohol dehydrogenase catalytic domain-containing protein [Dictyobacter formicarum]GHO89755.1 alcohol dehydrogenase [Dictyobacter formicarum]